MDEGRDLANQEYQYGFVTDLETYVAPNGINSRSISRSTTMRSRGLPSTASEVALLQLGMHG